MYETSWIVTIRIVDVGRILRRPKVTVRKIGKTLTDEGKRTLSRHPASKVHPKLKLVGTK
jgi:hypothetical protein